MKTTHIFQMFGICIALDSVSAFRPSPMNLFFHQKNRISESPSRESTYRCIIDRNHSFLCGTLENIEDLATKVAESWSIEVTPFLEPNVAIEVQNRLQNRTDIIALRVVGGRRIPSSSSIISKGEGRRSRFVLFHHDLALDIGTAETDYCTVILVENLNQKISNTFPDALTLIGVNLDQVGDIVTIDNSMVYLVVDPTVASRCVRLLPKELNGVGISLSVLDDHEYMPHGEIQEMTINPILERHMNRKFYGKGYVQFT